MSIKRKTAVCILAMTITAAFAHQASSDSTRSLASAAPAAHSPIKQVCPLLKPGSAYVGKSSATRQQRHVINVMLRESTKQRATFRVQVSILAAAMQESGARELPYGHGTSVGPLQLISIHGPARLRIRADFSSRWYLPQAIRIDRSAGTVAEIAVRVQRPADRKGYMRSINKNWKSSALLNVRNYRKACAS